MIPQSKIDEIIDAARVEEVVGDYVSLKKRGANLLGLCPFHQEKTPSFTVSPAKGIYKCFGCGKAGNSVNFIMEYEHLDYIPALKFIAEKYQIEWPEVQISDEALAEEKRKQREKESLQIINNFAEQYFAANLQQDEEGIAIGLSYFEERGFRPEIIEKFKLGYAKDNWDHFTQTALAAGYNQELLIKSGLIKQSEQGKLYDAYRGRVMFTIHGLNGKPIAFAGRFLKPDPKSPKYVNSPETELYHKSNELYGLYFARNAINKAGYVYLVEGYTDVIQMHQAGVENVVASSGTSLTENQIRLLKRFTDNVCVLYDGDAAGIKASLRGIDMLLEAGLNVKVMLFPDGEDPDSFCRKQGPLGFSAYLDENKQDFIRFKTSLLSADAGTDPIKNAELIKEVVQSIAKVPDAFKRAGFIKETSLALKVEEQLLITEINRLLRNKLSQQAHTTIPEPEEQPLNYEQEIKQLIDVQAQDYQEKDMVRLLINFGHLPFDGYQNVAHFIISEIAQDDIEIENQLVHEVLNETHKQLELGEPDVKKLVNHMNPEVSKFIAEILSLQYDISPNWEHKYDIIIDKLEDKYLEDIESAMNRLKLKNTEKLIKLNKEEMLKAEQEDDIEFLNDCMKVHQHLLTQKSKLSAKPGTVIL